MAGLGIAQKGGIVHEIPQKANAQIRLQAENLSVGFKNKTVLEHIQFAAHTGELLVLAGPNGGGKTTLLKTLGGFLKPLDGKVLLEGRDIQGMKKREKAEGISFLFQGAGSAWPFTVKEFIAQGRYPYLGLFAREAKTDIGLMEKAIHAAGLENYRDRPITELSGGEFQRTLIARAITQESSLILMDEPVNNLDPKYQLMVMDLIRSLTETGITVILSIHDLNLARLYATRVALIANGAIAALGPPAEALREDILIAVYDIPPKYQHYFRG